ncbi:MAG: hypothetical protein ABIW84_01465 [Ilumatobacteraceae bacterium]
MFKKLRRPIRPLYRSAALAFLWANRRDAARWAQFAKRAVSRTTRPNSADLKLEARVRASLSADPVLRGDPSIRDLRVHDGIVVLETPAGWHNRTLAITRLSQVKGVESVHTAADADQQQWLDVSGIETPVNHATA